MKKLRVPPNRYFAFYFCSVATVLIISHLLVFDYLGQFEDRHWRALSLGIGYDILVASLITLIGIIVFLLLGKRSLFVLHLVFISLCLFTLFDYVYVEQFGTHLPFSSIIGILLENRLSHHGLVAHFCHTLLANPLPLPIDPAAIGL